MSSNRYIPPRIQQLGNELRNHKNSAFTLTALRTAYPKLNSYQTALTRLRTHLICTEERHPDYGSTLQVLEERLVNSYAASLGEDGMQEGDGRLLECIKFLYDFRTVELSRQLKIVHKLRKGQLKLPIADIEDSVKQLPLLPDYVRDLHLTEDEQIRTQAMAMEAQQIRGSNVIRIERPNQLVKLCQTILQQSDAPIEDVCIALAVLTGRRTIEVLVTGRLDQIPGTSHFAYFSGQVKTGLQNIETATTDQPRTYPIPLLGNVKLIRQKLESVQSHIKEHFGSLAREVINQRFSYKLSKAVKRLIHPQFRVHDCRALYALVTYDAFKPHTFSINVWVCKVLGHLGVNMSTHYTTMQLEGTISKTGAVIPEFTSP